MSLQVYAFTLGLWVSIAESVHVANGCMLPCVVYKCAFIMRGKIYCLQVRHSQRFSSSVKQGAQCDLCNLFKIVFSHIVQYDHREILSKIQTDCVHTNCFVIFGHD